jgi:hypothetical protein
MLHPVTELVYNHISFAENKIQKYTQILEEILNIVKYMKEFGCSLTMVSMTYLFYAAHL